jgi:hypothetical protein
MFITRPCLILALVFTINCGSNYHLPTPAKKSAPQTTDGTAEANQKKATGEFYQLAQGQWGQNCEKTRGNSSEKSFFKFITDHEGTQQVVVYNDASCQGEVKDYKTRAFTYSIASMGSSYQVKFTFENPSEGETSSLVAIYTAQGRELNYKILNYNFVKKGNNVAGKGTDTVYTLAPVEIQKPGSDEEQLVPPVTP